MNLPADVRTEVDKLLAMYADYKQLTSEHAAASRALAKARLKNESTDALDKEYGRIAHEIQQLSDAMTFASPLIWAVYKYEAYAQEAQPIRTLQDFRVHCSKPGYICTKRFDFVNTALKKRTLPDLNDTHTYPDNAQLTAVYEALRTLSNDAMWMRQWNVYEYYKNGGSVAKWENFTVDAAPLNADER